MSSMPVGAPVDVISPPPVDIETPEGDVGEGEASVTVADAPASDAVGRLSGGHDAAEMARLRWAAARRKHENRSPLEVLRAVLTEQVSIATSSNKGVTAAARTAAARAVIDLQAAIIEAQEQERLSTGIDWRTMHPDRMTLIEMVLGMTTTQCTAWLAALRAEADEEERQAATTPPPRDGTPARA